MNIGLVGYGRMGRIIHGLAEQRGHKITLIIDPKAPEAHQKNLSHKNAAQVDGFIEFSLPEGLEENFRFYGETGAPVVVGTTGWNDKAPELLKFWKNSNTPGAILYGSNFSVGANLLFRISGIAAKMTARLDDYDVMIHEYHHKHKKDSPSGTALTLAQAVLDNNPRKKNLLTESLTNRAIRPDELHVSSTRGGAIPGTHTLNLDSEADTITISHTARNREGFALGSILGLEWLIGKTGIFTTDDFFDTLFKEQI